MCSPLVLKWFDKNKCIWDPLGPLVLNFDAILGPSPSKLKNFPKKSMVGYVRIEEPFDTIFNMGYGGGRVQHPPPFPIL